MPVFIVGAIIGIFVVIGLAILALTAAVLWHLWPLVFILGLVWFFLAKKAQQQGRPVFGRTYMYWHGPGSPGNPGRSGRRPMRTIDVVQGEPIREALPPVNLLYR